MYNNFFADEVAPTNPGRSPLAAHGRATKRPGQVLILWSDYFDEVAATIFTTELREAGLAAKVVGLAGRQATGLHGVLLGADLTLADALRVAQRALGIILPCTAATVRRIDNDPRVYELLQRACQNGALVILQQADALAGSRLNDLSLPSGNVVVYGEADDLINFARTLALTLSNQQR